MSRSGSESGITVDTLLATKVVTGAQVNPAGTAVAFVVGESVVGFKQPTTESRVWLAPVDGSVQPHAITGGPGHDDMPGWSPDGGRLAFRSDRSKRGSGQPYLLQEGFGEAERMTLHEFPKGISSMRWSPDGSKVAVIARDDPRSDVEEGDDWILWEADQNELAFNRVWLIDPANGEATCLTTGDVHVWEFSWAPDGSAIAAIVSDLPYEWAWYRARLATVDVANGEVKTIYAPERQLTGPVWSPDGRTIAVISSIWSDPGMSGGDVIAIPLDGREPHDVTPGQPISHESLFWLPDSGSERLLSAALERNRAAICEIGLDGENETLWSGEYSFGGYGTGALSLSAGASVLATTLVGPSSPSEVWIGRRTNDDGGASIRWEQLTTINRDFPGKAMPRIDTISWKAPDGRRIEGLLVRAKGVDGPAPMVVMIHGGPTGSSGYGMRTSGMGGAVPLLATRGFAVLLPNFRGSVGYGLEFAEANNGDMGGDDLADILAGVDYCIEQGIADPDRLGVCGWSYGGYMTAWAITQTDRFKAAVAGASITNWYSFHGGTNIPAFDEIFYGADPYALDGPYASRSPIFLVDQVKTPTLFLHGEQDACCPVGQAYEMARALRSRGIETECVIYPREPHGPRERLHVRDVMERTVSWFVTYLASDRAG